VRKRPIDSCRRHGSSPRVPSRLAQPHVRWREVGGKSRPSPAHSPTPIPCRVVAFWSLIQTCCLAAHLNRPHESARSAGKGLSIIVVPEHHESADNDHGGVSEANDSCWQQNPPEVQQNSSKWSQRIGWTVSTSTQVRWGTEFVHPHGADHGPRIDPHPGCRHRHGHELGSSLSPSSVNREAEVSQLMLARRESPLRMRRSPTTSEFLHPTRLLRSSRVRIFSYSRTSNMCCVWTPPSRGETAGHSSQIRSASTTTRC